jgi:hypothetical protein
MQYAAADRRERNSIREIASHLKVSCQAGWASTQLAFDE